jgi:hypothetical protein
MDKFHPNYNVLIKLVELLIYQKHGKIIIKIKWKTLKKYYILHI